MGKAKGQQQDYPIPVRSLFLINIGSSWRRAATVVATEANEISQSVPQKCEASASGNALTVRRSVGQYQRAINVPRGRLRGYVPCPQKPHPPLRMPWARIKGCTKPLLLGNVVLASAQRRQTHLNSTGHGPHGVYRDGPLPS